MKKLKLEIGKKFGKLTVLEESNEKIISKNGNKINGLLGKFKCDCGKIVTKPYRYAVRGSILSCGCSQSPKKSMSPNWRGHEKISGDYWGGIIRSAKIRKIDFEISIEHAWEKYLAQNGKCALSGEELEFGKTNVDLSCNASLDRIDSKKGYVEGNIQWVTKEVNRMKMDTNEERFVYLCSLISKNKENSKNRL